MNNYEQQQHLSKMTSMLYDTIARKETYLEQLQNHKLNDPINQVIDLVFIEYLKINIAELYRIYEDLRNLMED